MCPLPSSQPGIRPCSTFSWHPEDIVRFFAVKKQINPKTKESLASYYIRTHSHVIPDEVEFWEIDENEHGNVGTFKEIDFDLTQRFNGKAKKID